MSRLDKIFILLETGSNPQTRKLAATQIGEVVKSIPDDLFLVLNKLYPFLSSSSWDTRIAAGQALENILKNVSVWEPPDSPDPDLNQQDKTNLEIVDDGDCLFSLVKGTLNFETFNIADILVKGESLLSCDATEYSSGTKLQISDQRKALNKKLGLEEASALGMDTSTLFSNEDLMEDDSSNDTKQDSESAIGGAIKRRASELLDDEEDGVSTKEAKPEDPNAKDGLSAREINRLKRKNKLEHKAREETDDKDGIKLKIAEAEKKKDFSPPGQQSWIDSHEWPFQKLLTQLLKDIFAMEWEKRHGSVIGIRELMKYHGGTGGKLSGHSAQENIIKHKDWILDVLLRLVCILSLDRFGDYVSDQVIAPVRESASQAIGPILKYLDEKSIVKLVNLLFKLTEEKAWESRHGGMLGLKYILAVRSDLHTNLVPLVLPAILKNLEDDSDDVVSVAASSLLPVIPVILTSVPDLAPALTKILWDSLLDLDDLTSSTHSIMELLAGIVSQPEGLQVSMSQSGAMKTLVPRVFPFLSHSSIHVRKAGLETLLVLSSGKTANLWLPDCILDALRHVYQRALLEHNSSCVALIPKLWNSLCDNTPLDPLLLAGCPWFGPWIHLISGPWNQTLDANSMIPSKSGENVFYLGGKEVLPIVDPVEKKKYIERARNLAAKLLGKLATFIVLPMPGIVYTENMETPFQMLLSKVLIPQLGTNSAYQKISISSIIIQWAQERDIGSGLGIKDLSEMLVRNLSVPQNYVELAQQRARLFNDASDYISTLKHYNCDVDESCIPPNTTVSKIQELVGEMSDNILDNTKIRPKAVETIKTRRAGVVSALETYQMAEQEIQMATLSQLAGALSCLGPDALPDKLNPVIKPLMESIKREKNEELQTSAVKGLVRVLSHCLTRDSSPLDKVIINLATFLCANPEETPQVDMFRFEEKVHPSHGIMSLYLSDREAEKTQRLKNMKGKTDSYKASKLLLQTTVDLESEEDLRMMEIQVRGARRTLQELVKFFNVDAFEKLGKLEELAFQVVTCRHFQLEDIVNCLKILEVITPVLPVELHEKLEKCIPYLVAHCTNSFTAIRFGASNCIVAVASVLTNETMTSVIENLVPKIESKLLEERQGAIESIYRLSESLAVHIIPYIVLLVVPVLGSMSDQNNLVRQMATNAFATLVKLMPLEGGMPDPPNMPEKLLLKKEQQKAFLSQLLSSKCAKKYEINVKIEAELRGYQVEGVNWLGFLNKYKLHGILCDDMGLGKTLQTICLLANHHHGHHLQGKAEEHKSLVVCPATLGGHWLDEITRFAPSLEPFLYMGASNVRTNLRPNIFDHNIIISSYDIVRNDVEFLKTISWDYIVLDEGHVIKNTKSKTSIAIRKLPSKHRLILSGTPIQNGVTELWSLFDFLMPGYLGTEKQFNHRYARPIYNSRDAKSSVKDQEQGVLAMEALHRQTLPFILRRVKEDVLKELPPKITQDYECDLSPLQVKLYEEFANSQTKDESGNKISTSHVFHALQYLKKVCNHPKLVLKKDHPLFDSIVADYLGGNPKNILNIGHSAKLTALKQLLTDLGFTGTADTGDFSSPVVNQHRALIFFQQKSMLDTVENDLLKVHLPGVTYLRLDGSVPASQRHGIVTTFNSDPSIDLLLLTTSVGGLGLNLTGADTVIFIEHDWNPMKDLQAMDRAHRIGQKRVVNVYRLITRNTLEEKIMSLQKFKIHTAKSVITDDNTSLQNMETDQVLNLFSLDKTDSVARSTKEHSSTSIRSLIESMPELWEEEQYEEEYNMTNYVASLNS